MGLLGIKDRDMLSPERGRFALHPAHISGMERLLIDFPQRAVCCTESVSHGSKPSLLGQGALEVVRRTMGTICS